MLQLIISIGLQVEAKKISQVLMDNLTKRYLYFVYYLSSQLILNTLVARWFPRGIIHSCRVVLAGNSNARR